MQVSVAGTSTSNFVVTIEDGGGSQQYDIKQELTINEELLGKEVAECSAREHFWHQLSVDAERDRREFEEIQWAQYAAHTDRFARYYLRGIGDKNPTIADKKSAAILLFSTDTKDDPVFVQAAYNGYVQECKSVSIGPVDKETFANEMMYSYAREIGIDYEDAKAKLLSLTYVAERLKTIAGAFNAKSWAIKTMAADRRETMRSNI